MIHVPLWLTMESKPGNKVISPCKKYTMAGHDVALASDLGQLDWACN